MRCEPTASYDALSKKMSPEIVLQAAVEKAGKSYSDFASDLAKTLYEELYKGLSKEDVRIVMRCLTSDPGIDGLEVSEVC